MIPKIPIVFHVTTVPIPDSGIVRVPGAYAHEFASLPAWWREITLEPGLTAQWLTFPQLDPASARRARAWDPIRMADDGTVLEDVDPRRAWPPAWDPDPFPPTDPRRAWPIDHEYGE